MERATNRDSIDRHLTSVWQNFIRKRSLQRVRCRVSVLKDHRPRLLLGIDREQLAKDLGFDGVIPNSLDAVGDRDFILDFLFGSSMIMTHMSRFAEDLILYSSTEFGFVKLADAYSTVGAVMFTLVLN